MRVVYSSGWPLMVTLLAARSDLWGHGAIAVVAALMGVAGTLKMFSAAEAR
jgi:hypothetical protein